MYQIKGSDATMASGSKEKSKGFEYMDNAKLSISGTKSQDTVQRQIFKSASEINSKSLCSQSQHVQSLQILYLKHRHRLEEKREDLSTPRCLQCKNTEIQNISLSSFALFRFLFCLLAGS